MYMQNDFFGMQSKDNANERNWICDHYCFLPRYKRSVTRVLKLQTDLKVIQSHEFYFVILFNYTNIKKKFLFFLIIKNFLD